MITDCTGCGASLHECNTSDRESGFVCLTRNCLWTCPQHGCSLVHMTTPDRKATVLTVLLLASLIALAVVLASPIGAAAFTPDLTWSQHAHPGI